METQAADTAGFYHRWAELEAHGSSPTYERLAHAVAEDPTTLAFLHTLPRPKRQPNLLFGALRWFGAPIDDPDATLAFLGARAEARSEEHTSELQSRGHLVCRLLLEKKK